MTEPLEEPGAIGVCRLRSCERPVRSRGLCRAHYDRWLRHGDPEHATAVEIRAQVVENVEWMAGAGEPLPSVATRLGTNPVALERRLYRARRGDLVSVLKRGRAS